MIFLKDNNITCDVINSRFLKPFDNNKISINELEDYFVGIGDKKFRATQIYDFLYKKRVNDIELFSYVGDEDRPMFYATYEKNMIITANITFTGALAQYGTMIVEFPCTSSLTYNFGWPTD